MSASNAPSDETFSVRDRHLFAEECDAVELARRFGTPLYVVSETRLRGNARRIRRAFETRWPEGPVRVLASIKANSSLALRRILTEEGLGCDTFGPGELYAALQTGVPPEAISVNGSSKDAAQIERALEAGARITLDSLREIGLTRDMARRRGRRARVRFRIRPTYEEVDGVSDFYEEEVPVRRAAQEYKPGIPTEELLAAGPDALAAPELEVTGLMAHLGRHSADLDVWRGMARSFVATVAELSRAWGGWEPKELDIGGGFATPRDPTAAETARGRRRPADYRAPGIEEYATTITETLRSELSHHGLDAGGKVLEVEPGRALYADAGIHLAAVRNVKAQTRPFPWKWVETDTSEMFLLDTVVERVRWRYALASDAGASATETVDLVGISCGFDVIVHRATIPPAQPGDVIAFFDTGAYQDACANNFNALPRPGTVLVRGTEAEWVRRPETVEDVFRRDRIPIRFGVPRIAEVAR